MTELYTAPMNPLAPDTRPTSGLAISSLVLGILCLCLGPIALVPLILGIIGITQTGTNGSRKGMGFAIAGTALGGVGLLGTCFSIGIFLPALGKAKQTAERILSEAQISQLVIASENYALDHDGQYPAVSTWEQELAAYLGMPIDDILESPREDGDGVSYIYLGGAYPADPSHILIYEDPKHFPSFGVIVGFADGHTEMVPFDTFELMLEEQQADGP